MQLAEVELNNVTAIVMINGNGEYMLKLNDTEGKWNIKEIPFEEHIDVVLTQKSNTYYIARWINQIGGHEQEEITREMYDHYPVEFTDLSKKLVAKFKSKLVRFKSLQELIEQIREFREKAKNERV